MAVITANDEFTTEAAPPAVGRNMLWLIWSGTAGILNSILLWIFLARLRDVEELGRFTTVMGLYALFFAICSLGVMPFLVKEISRKSADTGAGVLSANSERAIVEFVSAASVLLLLSGLGCAVLMTISGFLVSESGAVRAATAILSLAMIPTGIVAVGESAAVALGRTRLIAFVSTVENLLRTVIPLGLIWLDFSISAVCVSFVAVRFAALLIYAWAARRKLADFVFNAVDFRKILSAVPTFGGTILLAALNWQAATILLTRFSTEAETAKYGVAARFLIPVTILMASYVGVVQPEVTRYAQKSIEKAGSYLSKMISYPLILSTAAAIAAPFLSRWVLIFLFGEKYADAASTLNLLAISVVPFCVVMIVSRGLVAIDSQRIDLFANALGAIVCVTANLILIPQRGAAGAAAAQLLSFLAMAVLETVYLSGKLINLRIWQKAGLASICLLAAYIVVWNF